ncbi:MAG: glycerol-3-phosphate acyltransferase [Dehalococcoidia bacterium]
MSYATVAILGYLIGSLPVAFLITRLFTGKDIRKLGTGNAGVMNTVRQAGLPAGMFVFVAEGAKGVGAYALGRALTGGIDGALLGALAALIGINWSAFLGFAGGRGTTLCAFITAVGSPWLFLASGLVWLTMLGIRRDNFFATRVNFVAYPLLALAIKQSWTYFGFAAAAVVILLLKHDRATDDHFQLARQPVPRE